MKYQPIKQIDIKNLKENMFASQTSSSDRKWFFVRIGHLIDIDSFCSFSIISNPELDTHSISAHYKYNPQDSLIIAIFASKEDAESYIDEIHNFIKTGFTDVC